MSVTATERDPLSFVDVAAAHPTRVAWVTEGRAVTYAEVVPRVRACARWLDAGVAGSDARQRRLAVVMTNQPSTLVLSYAALMRGVGLVFVHPRLLPAERAAIVADADPTVVVEDAATEPWAAFDDAPFESALPAIDPELPAVIVYTSGTTGRPKGAVLSRRTMTAAVAASAENLGWQEDDRWLLCMPLAHVGGFSIVTRCLAAARSVVLPGVSTFSPSAIAASVERDRVTLLSLVPTMLARMLSELSWRPPSHVRAILLGGAATPATLLERARDLGLPVLTTYGLTESCAQVTTQRYGTPPSPDQGSGPPLAGARIRIADDGEVQVQSATVMSGYLGVPPAAQPFTSDGWLKTGDLGRIDAEGRLHLLSRRSDLVVTGGENVYPAEVEGVLERIPSVAAVCVFGVRDPLWGEIVAAAIVARDPAAAPTPEEIATYARQTLASHKRPRRVAFVAALAVNASGKVDRAATRNAALPLLQPLGV